MFSAVVARLGTLEDAVVADLYAGSGALGFEALSRGARHVTFVERADAASRVIRANAGQLGVPAGAYELLRNPAEALSRRTLPVGPVSLLLLDPPYKLGAGPVCSLLQDLAATGWLAVDALIVFEHAASEGIVWPDGFVGDGELRYGDTGISLGWFQPDGSGDE
jgi:16S rRNA (guanine966-N2)-methyltransferase